MVNRDSSMNQNPEESVEDNAAIVVLNDEDGRSLSCYVERSVEVDGAEYVLLIPVDSPVEIFAWEPAEDDDEEEVLVDVDEETISQIFSTAQAVLAEQELSLKRTALTLTVAGDLPEIDEEELITLDLSDDEGDLSTEQLQPLASFFYEEQEFAIYSPVDPLLFFARLDESGEPKLLSPEEFQLVQPQLEDSLFDDFE